MEINDLKQHLDTRLDKLEGKLDNHLERISKAEVSIDWLRGHVKISTTFVLSALTGLALAVYQLITNKG